MEKLRIRILKFLIAKLAKDYHLKKKPKKRVDREVKMKEIEERGEGKRNGA